MVTRKRWTQQEERVLLNQVSRSPQNLQKAFEVAAEILGRTRAACEFRWYYILKHRENSVAFTLVSNKIATKNSKVGGVTKKIKKSLWDKIKELFK